MEEQDIRRVHQEMVLADLAWVRIFAKNFISEIVKITADSPEQKYYFNSSLFPCCDIASERCQVFESQDRAANQLASSIR